MNGAIVLLIVNAAVAAMFAVSYLAVAVTNRSQRSVSWFGVSYLIGMVTPLSEIAIHWASPTTPFMLTSYAALLTSFLAMSVALSKFQRQRPYWRMIAILWCGGMATRLAIWGGTRDTFPYELLYQLPFAFAMLLCAFTAARLARGRLLFFGLACLFGLIALHFLAKPFLAARFGSGASARDYAGSAYAVISQGMTGILLIAAGLVVLLLVIQTIVQESLLISESDALSGLLNRRGLDRLAQQAVRRAAQAGDAITVIMLDLDHFKTINDTYGHDVGDAVIQAFAGILRRTMPQPAIVGRSGGEEFVVVLEQTTQEGGRRAAEAVRVAVADCRTAGIPGFTLSAGVTQFRPGEGFSEMMRRADRACYAAKQQGRDRVILAPAEGEAGDQPGVARMRRGDVWPGI